MARARSNSIYLMKSGEIVKAEAEDWDSPDTVVSYDLRGGGGAGLKSYMVQAPENCQAGLDVLWKQRATEAEIMLILTSAVTPDELHRLLREVRKVLPAK